VARHLVVDLRHREAPFVAERHLVAGLDQLGVDQDERRVARFGGVDDDDPLVHVDLGRRQAHAFGLVHRLQHVVDQARMRASTSVTGRATVYRRGSG
jgi:hypothetical protein